MRMISNNVEKVEIRKFRVRLSVSLMGLVSSTIRSHPSARTPEDFDEKDPIFKPASVFEVSLLMLLN